MILHRIAAMNRGWPLSKCRSRGRKPFKIWFNPAKHDIDHVPLYRSMTRGT